MKTLSKILAGTALITGLSGCYPLQHAIKLKKYEPLSKEQKDSLFKKLNSGLKEYLKNVYIINEKDLRRNSKAHTHNNKKRTICFSEYFKNDSECYFHEAAHVRHIALDKNKSDFSEKWKKIADFKYGRKNVKKVWYSWPFILWNIVWKDDKTDDPKNGMLSPCSSTSINEDAAEFVGCLSYNNNPGEIKKSYINVSNPLLKEDSLSIVAHSSLYPLYFADTTDKRYQQKLDLLKDYNFLTEQEHKTLSERLGSLNYLREKYLKKPKEE